MEQDIKKRIYNCALLLFARQGYNGTSIRQIADKANVTIPMIYYYYKSKDNLLLTVLTEGIQQLKKTIVIDEDKDPVQKLEKAIYNFLHYCSNNKTMTALIFESWFGPRSYTKNIPSVEKVYVEITCALNTILQEGIQNHCFKDHDHHELSQNILGILTNYIARMLIGSENIDPARCSKTAVEFIIEGIHI